MTRCPVCDASLEGQRRHTLTCSPSCRRRLGAKSALIRPLCFRRATCSEFRKAFRPWNDYMRGCVNNGTSPMRRADHIDTGGSLIPMMATRNGIAVLATAGTMLLAALAVAPHAEAAMIYGCVKKSSGTIRIVTKKAKCKKGE